MRNILLFFTLLTFFCLPNSSKTQEYDWDIRVFEEKITLTRGVADPTIYNGYYLTEQDRCKLAIENWGWDKESCQIIDAFLIAIIKFVICFNI